MPTRLLDSFLLALESVALRLDTGEICLSRGVFFGRLK